jgi:3-oxoacid CoA-transferase subunit B
VLDLVDGEVVLVELAPDVTVEEVRAKTEPTLKVGLPVSG